MRSRQALEPAAWLRIDRPAPAHGGGGGPTPRRPRRKLMTATTTSGSATAPAIKPPELVRLNKAPSGPAPQLFIDGAPILSDQARPPLVSVVMANWNYAEYIGAALRSIREQDYSLFECIVVDNGSSDGSVDIIKRHIDGDPRFSLVELSENLGQLNAVLHVFDRLKGGFVVFADADDVLLP